MKLKRLVSAIVAVGMMVAMLPVSAFADHLTLDENGYINGKEIYDVNNAEDLSGLGQIMSTVQVYKELQGGTFNGLVKNYGEITGGEFADVASSNINNTNTCGQTSGALIKRYRVIYIGERPTGYGTTSLDYSVVWGSMSFDERVPHSIKNSIVPSTPPKDITSKFYEIDASGCTLTGTFNSLNYTLTSKMYIVGDESSTPAMSFTVKPSSSARVVTGWDVTNADYVDNKDGSITVTVPANNEKDVKIEMIKEEVPLTVSSNLPVDGKNDNGTYGSIYDGWLYSETTTNGKTTKGLTVYSNTHSNSNNTVNLGNEQVDWTVTNNGTIAGGKYTGKINNYGNITGGTYAGVFSNRDAVEDKNNNATGEGKVTSGVFSRSADFGTQNPDITWLTVKNNATINGIKDFTMAGIVGEQSVTITAPTGFKCWSVSGDSDLTLTEEQRTSKTLTLELDGSKKNTIVLTAMTPEGYQHFTVIDGKATNAEGKEITSAKADEPVTLTANAAPDGMVFDRWEVTPTAAEAKLEGFDASSATTTFKMGTQEITIRAMYRMADVEEPNVLGTAAVIGTVAVGGAVIAWQGYNIAADIYARDILPEGTAIPETKEALAVMLWQNAGKPEVVAADGTALTETEQAQQWVIANGLMENEADGTFHPEKGVGKFAALNAIKEQNEARVNE